MKQKEAEGLRTLASEASYWNRVPCRVRPTTEYAEEDWGHGALERSIVLTAFACNRVQRVWGISGIVKLWLPQLVIADIKILLQVGKLIAGSYRAYTQHVCSRNCGASMCSKSEFIQCLLEAGDGCLLVMLQK